MQNTDYKNYCMCTALLCRDDWGEKCVFCKKMYILFQNMDYKDYCMWVGMTGEKKCVFCKKCIFYFRYVVYH